MPACNFRSIAAIMGFLLVPVAARSDKPIKPPPTAKSTVEKIKEVAGTAEFLRTLPKHFARLQAVDLPGRKVTLLLEGDTLAKVWPVAADAEIKCLGWWGRLDQLVIGDRVWVWFRNDRRNQPAAVAMLADEISEQDIHGGGLKVNSFETGSIAAQARQSKAPVRTLKTTKAERYVGEKKAPIEPGIVGSVVFVQTNHDGARLVLDGPALDRRRAMQRQLIHQRWQSEGLPGQIAFPHIFSGEMDIVLDHEAMGWARSLKLGDNVTLRAEPPIKAVVRSVRPWRERTELRLVVNGADQADLVPGQRIHLLMAPPMKSTADQPLPLDLNRPRTRAERIEWFLASIYCTCGIAGDICTGHFYTLASCNPNGCGMPNMMRESLAAKIDKGMTDRQILNELLKEHGPNLLKPHLLP